MMFHCERCGSSFNASTAASAGSCPRCKLRTGKDVPLHFRLFEPSAMRVAGLDPSRIGKADRQVEPERAELASR
jgi:predicted  nucleic acid-binding Zn-ribbon protein